MPGQEESENDYHDLDNKPIDQYVIKQILKTDPVLETWRDTLKDLFIKSFSHAYRDVELDLPPGQSLYTYLEHAFNTTWPLIQSGKLQLWIVIGGTPETAFGFMFIQQKENICYIEQFAIHPDFQRMKIGTNLLKVVEERYHLIWLHTRYVNKGAISFYTRRGFTSSGNDDDSIYPPEFPSRSPDIYLRMKKRCQLTQTSDSN